MSSFIVGGTAALNSVLTTAHAGDTIKLAPGTYSGVTISGVDFLGAVTITSQDPAHAAVITDLTLAHDQGLAFSNLEFAFPLGDGSSVPHGIEVNWSRDIHFRSDNIHGVLNIAPTDEQTGVDISNSSGVSVENSELQFLFNGLTMDNGSNILVSGDNFHDIRLDGIEGAAIQNGTVTDNNFSNFHHIGFSGQGGDHSDAIQFWTTGQTVGSANLTVSNNVIVQGQGRDMQGIFIQDSGHTLPYKNLQITGNLVIGGNWNGIMADDARHGTIANNIIQGLSTQPQDPWMLVQHSRGVTVTGNSAGSLNLSEFDLNISSSGNTVNPKVTDQGLALLTSWLASHPGHDVPMGPNTAHALIFPAVTFAEATDAAQSSVQLLGLRSGALIGPNLHG